MMMGRRGVHTRLALVGAFAVLAFASAAVKAEAQPDVDVDLAVPEDAEVDLDANAPVDAEFADLPEDVREGPAGGYEEPMEDGGEEMPVGDGGEEASPEPTEEDAPAAPTGGAIPDMIPDNEQLGALSPPYEAFADVEYSGEAGVAPVDGVAVADLGKSTQDNPIACAEECTATEGCNAFTWMGANPDWDLPENCYTKTIGVPCELPQGVQDVPTAYLVLAQEPCDPVAGLAPNAAAPMMGPGEAPGAVLVDPSLTGLSPIEGPMMGPGAADGPETLTVDPLLDTAPGPDTTIADPAPLTATGPEAGAGATGTQDPTASATGEPAAAAGVATGVATIAGAVAAALYVL